MATPTDKANHTSTKRMMFEVLRRYCMGWNSKAMAFHAFFTHWGQVSLNNG